METMENLKNILNILLNATPPPKTNDTLKESKVINLCDPIKTGEIPQHNVSFISLTSLLPVPNTEIESKNSLHNNLENSTFTLGFGLNFFFNQNWLLRNVAIGDFSSSITLAPSEKLTLEFQNTQRKLLEQSVLDSTEQLQSDESTSIDKDVMNVVRDSTKTKNWSVNANGSFSLNLGYFGFSLGGSGGVNNELVEKNKTASQSIREATLKSSENLKSLHKIEVKGTSEYIVTNRMTRVIENPYNDRTLNINVFQLVKNYITELSLRNVFPSLIINISDFNFDKEFIQSNSHFLKENLLDTSLKDNLDSIFKAINSHNANAPSLAQKNALLALKYLFEVDNIFNVGYKELEGPNPNNISNSFDASIIQNNVFNFNLSLLTGLTQPKHEEIGDTHLHFEHATQDVYLLQTMLIFNYFYQVYKEKKDSLDGELALNFVSVLASAEIQSLWQSPHAIHSISYVMDLSYAELVRRLPGFFTMVNHMVKPYVPKLEEDSLFKQPFNPPVSTENTGSTQQKDSYDPYLNEYYKSLQQANISNMTSLDNLIEHLNFNKEYYIQQYLIYLSTHTKNQSILDFVSYVVSSIKEDTQTNKDIKELIPLIFSLEDSYINAQQVIIPSNKNLSEETITEIIKVINSNTLDFNFNDFSPILDNVQVPTDGIHLEISKSKCILPNLNCTNICCKC